MGSEVSRPLDRGKVAEPPEVTAPAKPAPLSVPGAPTPSAQGQLFNNCWSCRVLSGSGLIGAGLYVYAVARRPMKLGYAPGPLNITQMVVGISIATWGIVIMAYPKGKEYRV
uniref:Distal membrane arm assembly component 1 n=2 Tax=Loxodonta africana TaxID=9785 RepID=G3TAF7_LOXAF